MEIQVGDLEPLDQQMEILSSFKGLRKIYPNEASSFISMAFSLFQVIIKHKNTEVGNVFINRLNNLIQECLCQVDIRYLSNILKYYIYNEIDPENFISNIINTENALLSLAYGFCYFFKYLIGGKYEMTCVSIKFNKDQLNVFCSKLDISMMVIIDKGKIDFLGELKNDQILMWLYEENAHHSVLIADLNLDSKDFPFRYKKAIHDINHIDFNIATDNSVQGFPGFEEVVKIGQPEFSFFIAFIISLMHTIKTFKSTKPGQDFIEKFSYLITQTKSSNPTNVSITYFSQVMDHLINYENRVEITSLLRENRDVTVGLILGLDILLKTIFPNDYTRYYNEIKYQTHKNLLNGIAEKFGIIIIIYEYPNFKHVIGTPQLKRKLLLTFGQYQNSFCFYIPDKSLSLKSYPNMVYYDEKLEILSSLMTSWGPIQKKFIEKDDLETLKMFFSFTSEINVLHDFSQLKTLASTQICEFNHDINLYYTLSCGHAHCTECLFTDIRSYNREDIKCYVCTAIYEDRDIIKIVKKVLKRNKKLELIEKKIIQNPNRNRMENTSKLCQICKINRKSSYFLLFKCRENCNVCFRCRLSSSNYCFGCKSPLGKDTVNEIAKIKCQRYFNDIDRDKSFLCMICKIVKVNNCKCEACDCSDVCIKCTFGRGQCSLCQKILKKFDVKCFFCNKEISESKDLHIYEKCGHQLHVKCKSTFNGDTCSTCICVKKNY